MSWLIDEAIRAADYSLKCEEIRQETPRNDMETIEELIELRDNFLELSEKYEEVSEESQEIRWQCPEELPEDILEVLLWNTYNSNSVQGTYDKFRSEVPDRIDEVENVIYWINEVRT